jgi:predicted O-methyltransferase YrrM
VLSFEDSEFWVEHIRERLSDEGITTVELRMSPVEELPQTISALPGSSFDLVVVDFLESPAVTRIDCLRPAMERVRPGGYLLLDDSDRPGYAAAYQLLAGWRERRFTGVKDGWPEVCETAIFRRPK